VFPIPSVVKSLRGGCSQPLQFAHAQPSACVQPSACEHAQHLSQTNSHCSANNKLIIILILAVYSEKHSHILDGLLHACSHTQSLLSKNNLIIIVILAFTLKSTHRSLMGSCTAKARRMLRRFWNCADLAEVTLSLAQRPSNRAASASKYAAPLSNTRCIVSL